VFAVRTAVQSWFVKGEEGASMVEYALLVALIALVVIAGALFLGTEIGDKLSDVGATLQSS
jgi:pilus assembly protein Flp/PilA